MSSATQPATVHTVTFDCWSTLLYEAPGQHGTAARNQRLAAAIGADRARVDQAFADAWRAHQNAWHRRTVFAGAHMLEHTLRALGASLTPAAHAQLLAELEEDILEREICAIEGARELLAAVRAAGIRTALICDTGFTPGRVVRSLLARVGLLEFLEVTIFSDEIGVPKPHARAFTSALSALNVPAHGAAHVGDLRRSDVAGARAAGMTSIRFRGHHDDREEGPAADSGVIGCAAAGCTPPCERPEADLVVDTYTELSDWLGLPS